MALILLGRTECLLCGDVIAADDDLVATSHFIADPADSLWRYSDAAFHRRCFAAWERRDEFVRRFNESTRTFNLNGKRQHMEDDGGIVMVEFSRAL